MAATKSPLSLTSGLYVIRDTSPDVTVDANVNTGSATVYSVYLDNSANADEVVYFKAYNSTSPTYGTTAPDLQLCWRGGEAKAYKFLGGGLSFGTGLSYVVTTTPGTGSVSDVAPTLATPLAIAIT